MNRLIAAVLGLGALTQAQVAQAQTNCVAPEDLDDTIIYAMPLAYDAALNACSSEFKADGFIATSGADFIEGFRNRQDQAWPGAFRLLKAFMAQPGKPGSSPEFASLISSLPQDSLRPFVNGIIVQMIIPEIKPDTCGKIERGLELISPLPVENVSGLATFLAEQSDLKNPEICKPSSDAAAE